MFHVCAYTVALGTTANTDVAALSDDIIYIQNGHFFPTTDMQILAAFAASATLSRSRLNSPKLRQITPAYIRPLNVGTLPANNANVQLMPDWPFRINGQEELVNEATSGIAMGTERYTCLLWMTNNWQPAPLGDVYNLRWTSTTTATANAWTTISATYEQQLPFGTYAVVGSEAQSTNGIAHRLIFDYQYLRPGTLMLTSLANRLPYNLHPMTLGKWGEFKTVSLPRFQVLCNAADAAFEGYLNVVRVG